MPRRIERYGPFVIAATVMVVVVYVMCEFKVTLDTKTLPATTMAFGLIAAGFAATQRNVFLGMRGSRVMRFMAQTGFYIDVMDYSMQCIYSALTLSIVSLAGFFIDGDTIVWKIWVVVITYATVLVLMFMFRNEILMSRIIRRFVEESA